MSAVYVPPANSKRTVVAPYGATFTGQSLTYTVYDSTGTVNSTGSMVEIGSTGIYTAYPVIGRPFNGVVVCGAPTGLDPYVRELE
jgi:hypothetical protein